MSWGLLQKKVRFETCVRFGGKLHHEKSCKRTNLHETYQPVGTFRSFFVTDPSSRSVTIPSTESVMNDDDEARPNSQNFQSECWKLLEQI